MSRKCPRLEGGDVPRSARVEGPHGGAAHRLETCACVRACCVCVRVVCVWCVCESNGLTAAAARIALTAAAASRHVTLTSEAALKSLNCETTEMHSSSENSGSGSAASVNFDAFRREREGELNVRNQ